MLPGRPIEAQKPVVLEKNRNDGLPAGVRTDSRRARDNAAAAHPEVIKHLEPHEWAAHHLISLGSIRRAPEAARRAAGAGWKLDDPGNLAALPRHEAAQRKLAEHGIRLPIHGANHPKWNERDERAMHRFQNKLRNLPKNEQPETARRWLQQLQDDNRAKLATEKKLSQNTTLFGEADRNA